MKMEVQLMSTTKAQPIRPVKNMPSSKYMHQTINLKIIVATHQVVCLNPAEQRQRP